MSKGPAHPSALDWARYLSGEARWTVARRVRRHLPKCEPCRQREAEMAAERRSFDASPLRKEEARRLWDRATCLSPPAQWKPPRWSWAITGGVAAVAIAVLAVHVSPRAPSLLVEKGGDVFSVYVEGSARANALGSRCAPGDRLIGRYRTEHRYLLVLERDGRGSVQVLHPLNGTVSAQLTAAEGTTSTSWILDAAPGQECFLAFFSDQPLTAAEAIRSFTSVPQAPVLPHAVVRVQCCEKGRSR